MLKKNQVNLDGLGAQKHTLVYEPATKCNFADVNCLLYNPSKKQSLSEKNKAV